MLIMWDWFTMSHTSRIKEALFEFWVSYTRKEVELMQQPGDALAPVLDGSTAPKMPCLKGDINLKVSCVSVHSLSCKRRRLKPIWFKPKMNLLDRLLETSRHRLQSQLDPGIKWSHQDSVSLSLALPSMGWFHPQIVSSLMMLPN